MAYAGRVWIIASLSEVYSYGQYRALLAECPASGLNIYWEPILVEGSVSQHLTEGASMKFGGATYVPRFEDSGFIRAVFVRSETTDVLGCGD